MNLKRTNRITLAATLVLTMVEWVALSRAEDKKYATLTNAQAQEMLNIIQSDIKENYYDPTIRGMNLDKTFEEARQKIAAAKSQDEALLDIAGALSGLKDSHTSFRPPMRPYGVEYGWRMEAIGDSHCYITAVQPDSDATAKGMKAGDRVMSINGVPLSRQNIHNVEYAYAVFPQSGFHLFLRSPDGVDRSVIAMSKTIPGQNMIRHADFMAWVRSPRSEIRSDHSKYYNVTKQVVFWKLNDFSSDPDEVASAFNKVRSYETIVLDLRGNPGGRVDTEKRLIGSFFDHDVKIFDRKGRKDLNPEIAKTIGHRAFEGKLIVLVDSKSASAAEIFARVVQLEKRGTVLGDQSSGSVMEAKMFIHAVQLDRSNVTQYGSMITIADVIMRDGNTLENVGVTPDERILPSPADIAAGRDPVLARAAALAGLSMTSEDAGKIFSFEWPKETMPEMD